MLLVFVPACLLLELNPIERFFPKLKAPPSPHERQNPGTVREAIGNVCNSLDAQDYWNVFKAAAYRRK
ncbi:MAG: hypothetical protein FJX25_12490 [Alphaproteobacteria bacterium]|nr:hypothetical protein [Alphaproteobacteria bacterium]